MESNSRFSLESGIITWRKQFAGSLLQAEKISELESHLRDSVESLRNRGVSEEDAFAIATYRLGSAGTLTEEFSKANQESLWMERVLWMLVGAEAVTLLTQFSDLLRGFLWIPRFFARVDALQVGIFWAPLLSVFQYVILGGLLVVSFRLLKFSAWESAIHALIRKPGRWCSTFFLMSFVTGTVSFGIVIFPEVFRTWLNPSGTPATYHYPNFSLTLLSFASHALLLPITIFFFVRLRLRPNMDRNLRMQ